MANAIRDAVQKFRFERFDPRVEDWEYYIQRFETELQLHNLLEGQDSAEARKKTCCWLRWALQLLRFSSTLFDQTRLAPRPEIIYLYIISAKTYNVLKETLQRHFKKDTCIIAERVKFTLRHRKEGETVTQFVMALRAIADTVHLGWKNSDPSSV